MVLAAMESSTAAPETGVTKSSGVSVPSANASGADAATAKADQATELEAAGGESSPLLAKLLPAGVPTPDFSGVWTVDLARSDDPGPQLAALGVSWFRRTVVASTLKARVDIHPHRRSSVAVRSAWTKATAGPGPYVLNASLRGARQAGTVRVEVNHQVTQDRWVNKTVVGGVTVESVYLLDGVAVR